MPRADWTEITQVGSQELEELIDRITAEEFDALREAFARGAEFAVTRMDSPRDRVLHRLECTMIEPHLDRGLQWTDGRRARLAADPRFRLALPSLLTREEARRLTGVRSCKVCWPNLHGRDPAPLRRLRARGLRDPHVGRILSTETGEPLGSIARVATKTGPDLFGQHVDAVEVETSVRIFAYAPSEHVYLWKLPTDAEAIERKTRLFHRLGSGPDLVPAL